jgi:flavodoxin
MKVLVTYSSLTGNTKMIAEGIFKEIGCEDKVLLPIKEVKELERYDVVLVGYWVDKGGPNEEAKVFLEGLKDKQVGIFATLGFWADSDHAYRSLTAGEELVKENNKVIGRYICQGKINPSLIERFKSFPADNPHAITPEKLRRYEIAAKHPNEIDVMAAAQLFRERLEL